MQRRHFMKLTGMLATLPAIKGIAATSEKPAPSGKQLYEWRIYTLEEDADGLDGFFRDTLIPAYNRKNIKAGAFVPYKKRGKRTASTAVHLSQHHDLPPGETDHLGRHGIQESGTALFRQDGSQPGLLQFRKFPVRSFRQSTFPSDAGQEPDAVRTQDVPQSQRRSQPAESRDVQ